MSKMTLVIGNKNYSSWSLRPWLVLRQVGLAFEEVLIPLLEDGSKERILSYTPSGKVPVLVHGDVTVWDSLAICEYLAETFPEKQLWPSDSAIRARARSVSAEMHAGFMNLRQGLTMNIRRHLPGRTLTEPAQADIARIRQSWTACRDTFGRSGPFLFGDFTIADAMYAPVATRFATYGITLEGAAGAYMQTLLALPAMQEWRAAAQAEAWVVPQYEPVD